MSCVNYLEGINFGKSGQKNPPEAGSSKLGTGRATLRLRSTGPATVEEEVLYIVPTIDFSNDTIF